MLIAVDLDAIASRTNSPGLAWMLNDAFDLGIGEAQLEQLSTIEELEKIPQAKALFEQAEQDARLSRRLSEVIEAAWDDQQQVLLQRTALPVRHAAQALCSLSQTYALLYVTWRLPQTPPAISEWLLLNGYPQPRRVAVCQHPTEPFEAAQGAARNNESILLITSHCEAMIDAFRMLPQSQRERFFLAAFRRPQSFSVDEDISFSVFALPSWTKEHVVDLFAEIDGYQRFQHWLRAG